MDQVAESRAAEAQAKLEIAERLVFELEETVRSVLDLILQSEDGAAYLLLKKQVEKLDDRQMVSRQVP